MHRPLNDKVLAKAEKETFRTPIQIWESLFIQFPQLVIGDILDPSGGRGELLLKAIEYGKNGKHYIFDIRKQELGGWYKSGLSPKIGQYNCKVTDFLEYPIENIGRKFDTVISNGPFSLTKEFVDKSLKLCKKDGHVIFLQRLNWLSSIKRSHWFKSKPFKQLIVINKRPIWGLDDRENNISDVYDYGLFVFSPSFTGRPRIDWLFLDKKKRFYPKIGKYRR